MLDDFGSELDPARRMAVLAGLRGSMQVLITATHPRDLGGEARFDLSAEIRHGTLV
ncbi:MAG: recombination protein F [candidate division BRC1 bacterium ADurb.BinA292]|nr:MAG: recombination protein F [candidate division BRC1 bacterium ADurb.BinA292]